jgi:hypothetical protein
MYEILHCNAETIWQEGPPTQPGPCAECRMALALGHLWPELQQQKTGNWKPMSLEVTTTGGLGRFCRQ